MLAINLEPVLEEQLASLAKQQGRTQHDVAQEAIRLYVFGDQLTVATQQQSQLFTDDTDELSALDFIEHTVDQEGWE